MEDLEIVAEVRPDFIGAARLRWMHVEVARLEARVGASEAFQEPACSPIHGDLWADNLLLAADGAWHILDWDDLTVGDPALDWAILPGPSPTRLRPLNPKELPFRITRHAGLRERLEPYARTSLLDRVIDVLADYVEADRGPHPADRTRAEKRSLHLKAPAVYEERYAS